MEGKDGAIYHTEEVVFTEEMMKEVVESEEFKQLSKEEQAEILKEFGLE